VSPAEIRTVVDTTTHTDGVYIWTDPTMQPDERKAAIIKAIRTFVPVDEVRAVVGGDEVRKGVHIRTRPEMSAAERTAAILAAYKLPVKNRRPTSFIMPPP
jgi:hypothetical protein